MKTIILFDTEYTAWEGSQQRRWSAPGEHREIIQIAAVRASLNGRVQGEAWFNRLVMPQRNPLLSAYVSGLTGITQSAIEAQGMPFSAALADFNAFCGEGQYPLFSWGDDPGVLRENCRLAGVAFPEYTHAFHDVRDIFTRCGIDTRPYSSGTVWQALDLALDLEAHDALNDVRSLLATMDALAAQDCLQMD